ncbi:hypothetical protein PG994_009935 [Apiospora phragmitis]|uniref:Uncharacterized protein n=1 Tax=Apiospora phragmitis TaxID=2905665 RepID=A0ABR1TNH3_9PEZI
MADPSSSNTAHKRPHEGPANNGSNKLQRIAQFSQESTSNKYDNGSNHSIANAFQASLGNNFGKTQTDECTSQTFVTEDGRLITDSIPNHVRRHDAEITKQGKSLYAVLNAHGGFDERLSQHDEKLADNEKLIHQQVEANSSKIALDEVARKEIANLKDTIQARFDAIDRKTTQRDTKVHQALSAMAKCLQELGHLAELAAEGEQLAAVQVAQVQANLDAESGDVQERPDVPPASRDAGSRNPQDPKNYTRQGIIESNGALQVFERHYFPWLDSLDFRPPLGIVQYKDASLMFYEIELFKYKTVRYSIVTNSSLFPPIVKKSREERGYFESDNFLIQSSDERAYLHHVLEMEVQWPLPPQGETLPHYVLPLGHFFESDPKIMVPVVWSGFHVVMDVTTPSKSLWLVYCSEGDHCDPTKRHRSWPLRFPDILKNNGDAVNVMRLSPNIKGIFEPLGMVSGRQRYNMERDGQDIGMHMHC